MGDVRGQRRAGKAIRTETQKLRVSALSLVSGVVFIPSDSSHLAKVIYQGKTQKLANCRRGHIHEALHRVSGPKK